MYKRIVLGGCCVALIAASSLHATAAAAGSPHWIDAWSAAPDSASPPIQARTLREVVHLGIAGSALRIRLSNQFGKTPLTIGPVHLAQSAGGSAILAGSDHRVSFRGRDSVTISAGADVLSDPVAISTTPAEDLAVSLYLPAGAGASTMHGLGNQTAYLSQDGDATATTSFPVAEISSSRYFLTDVEVAATPTARTLAVIGDSITDGAGSTPERNARWTDALASRIAADRTLAPTAVINAGIAGNRLLHDADAPYIGPSALSRFTRDAAGKPGVRWVLLLEGINDIGAADSLAKPDADASAAQIIQGMQALIAQAHAHGLKIWGATLTPYAGVEWPYHTAAGEAKRQAVNQWIRSAGAFDEVIDLDRTMRDPSQPGRLLAAFDSGDHLHPNDAGYKAMAAAVELRWLQRDR